MANPSDPPANLSASRAAMADQHAPSLVVPRTSSSSSIATTATAATTTATIRAATEYGSPLPEGLVETPLLYASDNPKDLRNTTDRSHCSALGPSRRNSRLRAKRFSKLRPSEWRSTPSTSRHPFLNHRWPIQSLPTYQYLTSELDRPKSPTSTPILRPLPTLISTIHCPEISPQMSITSTRCTA